MKSDVAPKFYPGLSSQIFPARNKGIQCSDFIGPQIPVGLSELDAPAIDVTNEKRIATASVPAMDISPVGNEVSARIGTFLWFTKIGYAALN